MHLPFLTVAGEVCAALLVGAGFLHVLPTLGRPGRKAAAALCRAPGLDLLITYFTIAPLFFGPIVAGWRGFAGAIVGQVAGVLIWTYVHELANRKSMRGPRIVKVLNRIVGRWRNHAALWTTATLTPMFWVVRVAELIVYPIISKLVGLPKYESAQWVNVSRHKFRGLVGHDRIWCLYCDWMTGVWSLGSEMLRNVESFWCPIRFDHSKKCANCATDFPDVAGGWVAADGDMAQVALVLEEMYGGGERSWFGRRVAITLEGKELQPVGK